MSAGRFSAIFATALLALLCRPAPLPAAAASVLEDAVLTTDTTWSGVVTIRGVVVVARAATLTIEPGTEIRFLRLDRNRDGIGDGELRVLGRLVARGNRKAPIRFHSGQQEPAAMDWSYVLLYTSGAANLLEYCEFNDGFTGLQVHFSTARVSHCRFQGNHEGIRFGRAHLEVTGSLFHDNHIGVRFTRMEGPVRFTGNRVTANRVGIFLVPSGQNIVDFFEPDRSGRPWNTGRLTIRGNDIFGNTWYNFKLGAKQQWDLEAPDNWWGTVDPAAIRATLFDKHRDANLGEIRFQPPAAAPLTGDQPDIP